MATKLLRKSAIGLLRREALASRKMVFTSLWNALQSRGLTGLHSFMKSVGMEKKQTFSVVVEGNIASGKTSLLKYFQDNYPEVYTLKEPVEKWRNINGCNALELLYKDASRWALTLQTYVQLTMLENHQVQPEEPTKLMERSIYSAKYCFVENLYRSGKMPELEYLILSRWFNWILENEKFNIDLIVYLRTKPEIVHERIKKRCRPEEHVIPIEYLQALHELHENWLIHNTEFYLPAPVLVIDGDGNCEQMIQRYEVHKDQILGYSSLERKTL